MELRPPRPSDRTVKLLPCWMSRASGIDAADGKKSKTRDRAWGSIALHIRSPVRKGNFVAARKVAGRSGSKIPVAPVAAPSSADAQGDQHLAGAFPIVGIGASAGGLEAFEQFFRYVPTDSGMAFVLVQHLDPEHASLLTEILQRSTTMPVVEATDQMTVAANRVHVIPPNRDMAVFHGILQLSIPEQPRGQRMPIDAFLRSPTIRERRPSASSSPAPEVTALWGCVPSSAPAAFLWCRSRPVRNMTACPPAQSRPATPPMCSLWKICRRCC